TAADAGCAGEPRTSLRSAGTCTTPSDASPASLAGPVPVHHLAHHRPLAVTKGKKNHSRKKSLIRPPEEQPPNKVSVSYPPENDGFLLAADSDCSERPPCQRRTASWLACPAVAGEARPPSPRASAMAGQPSLAQLAKAGGPTGIRTQNQRIMSPLL